MARLDTIEIAARNKENYLKAKAAFNAKDMAGCMSFYAPDHQIRSRDVGRGREHVEQFLTSMHEGWSDLQIIVEHTVAEGDWVMGHCTTVATHAKPVMGIAPTNRRVQTTFWDLHRFDEDGRNLEPDRQPCDHATVGACPFRQITFSICGKSPISLGWAARIFARLATLGPT